MSSPQNSCQRHAAPASLRNQTLRLFSFQIASPRSVLAKHNTKKQRSSPRTDVDVDPDSVRVEVVAADQRPRGGVQVKAAPFVVHGEAIQQEVVGRGMPARVRDAKASAGVLLENVLRVSIIYHRRCDRRAVQRNGGHVEPRLEADEGAA